MKILVIKKYNPQAYEETEVYNSKIEIDHQSNNLRYPKNQDEAEKTKELKIEEEDENTNQNQISISFRYLVFVINIIFSPYTIYNIFYIRLIVFT